MISISGDEGRGMKGSINKRRGAAAGVIGGLLIFLLLAGGTGATRMEGAEAVSGTGGREAHPLWRGRLGGLLLDRRVNAFAAAFDRGDDPATLFATFLDEIGVGRLIDTIEGESHACHGGLHALGAVLIDRTDDIRVSMMLCGDACTYACVHGAIERHLSNTLKKEPAAPGERIGGEVLSLCREGENVLSDFFPGNCAHAVGHAFANFSVDLAAAKARCSIFPDQERRYYCESGVFMERRPALAGELFQGESSRARKGKIALRFCLRNTEWPSACLRFLLEPAERPAEIDAVRADCARLDGKSRRGCFHTVGYISRAYVASRPEEINRVCPPGDPTDQTLCLSGLAFMKKGHRLKGDLARSCGYLADLKMKAICDDQHRRFYYQVDNAVIKAMLSGD